MVRVAVLTALLIFLSSVSRAQEPARLALIIGNQDYSAKVGPLKNPRSDAALVEASLKQLSFKVTVLKDASYKAMDSALKRYVTEVRRAGRNALSFFYYSGHGVANPETQINYLIPVAGAVLADSTLPSWSGSRLERGPSTFADANLDRLVHNAYRLEVLMSRLAAVKA